MTVECVGDAEFNGTFEGRGRDEIESMNPYVSVGSENLALVRLSIARLLHFRLDVLYSALKTLRKPCHSRRSALSCHKS